MASLQEDGLVVLHEKVAQQTYRLRIRSPGIAAEARAGQFVMVQVRKGIDPLLRRPFPSIACCPPKIPLNSSIEW